jgi:ADP-dependent NAD(P)H-hydrate dehydratase / NAD(P)H-hydrate epimerase
LKLVTVAEMQDIERAADAAGLSYAQMMENAGRGLAEVILAVFSPQTQHCALGLVGSGNNGGDTLVALKRLADQGWSTTAYLARPRQAGESLVEQLESAGGEVVDGEQDGDLSQLRDLVASCDLLMDGILGTGASLPLREEVARVLSAVGEVLEEMQTPSLSGDRSSPPYVVAVDCPSGVDLDSGAAADEALPADLTITMAAVKEGLLRFPAYELVGELQVVSIGRVEDLPEWQKIGRFVLEEGWVHHSLPERPLDAHKGTFGTAMLAAGSVNYTGAALLAGEAAYRVGAGLVTLAVPGPVHLALAGRLPEATWVILPSDMGVISREAAAVLRKNLNRATALLVGPGLGVEDTTREFLAQLLGQSSARRRGQIGFKAGFAPEEQKQEQQAGLPPLIVDADGLKLLARNPDWPQLLPDLSILTPHPGEMAVLTGLDRDEIQANRFEIAERFAAEWGHVVVLKGAFTVIAAPDGRTAVIPVATPALARAGTGDVLAGLIAGLVAQGVQPFDAAAAGAWIHAQAGLAAREGMGNSASVLAGDVLNAVAEVLTALNSLQTRP